MTISRRIILEGRVQGFGVRPAIARLAERLGLTGSVRNRLCGVEIEIHGEERDVEQFESELVTALPDRAVVDHHQSESIASAQSSGTTDAPARFHIEVATADAGPTKTSIPPDVVMCDECLHDIRDERNRRHEYPLTTCAACGPRYSVIGAMPFERNATTLHPFAMCAECAAEYSNSEDRRFHAQTIACPNCGPRVWCVDGRGRVLAAQQDAVHVAVEALKSGQIVALRGIGGYQLLCDATSSSVVSRLRARKRRPSKPLAVMVQSLSAARTLADIDSTAAAALASPANPIVLLAAKSTSPLATEVHPGLRDVGVLLPSSPLHELIARHVERPLVATSGNLEGEPLAIEIAEAESQLTGVADLWLHHDRAISNAVDDSVVRIIANRVVTLRMARGFAPLRLPEWPWPRREETPVLAAGGQMKNAFAFENGEQAVLGPHIGDLGGERTRQRFVAQVDQLQRLFGARSKVVVHDAHPEYFTTEWANGLGLHTLAVQHHHAHIAATSWEHDWLDREVLGFAWDGTGFGIDGSIWGGETLRSRGSRFQRVGSCRPFRLPGGELAIHEPWRVAAVLLRDAVGEAEARRFAAQHLPARDIDRFFAIGTTARFAPQCTSIGRLFDAVAAMVLGIARSDFEGEPAMRLESLCQPHNGTFQFVESETHGELDWRPLVQRVWQDLKNGVPSLRVSELFHHSIARFAAGIAQRHPELPIVVSGGVFQNRVLVESLVEQLGSNAARLGLPGQIPMNDGGLAAGQLAVAMISLRGD